MSAADTIFALSSGQPPAGIAVVRISGGGARGALERLVGRVPAPRRAVLAALREDGELLDRALILFLPGPGTATGEDIAELHLHGGRAVIDAVLLALGRVAGLRKAEPGEFTRRAVEHGRLDLAEAEGLADLLEAETETQRRAALLLAGGALGLAVSGWTQRLLSLAARVEALLDFADEGDVEGGLPASWQLDREGLAGELRHWLARPPAERLKEGVRVVIAGPPNSGKSTLLNAIVGRAAAITSDMPGTTRDLIEVPVALDGIPFLLTDSAGLRETSDEVEAIGVARAEAAMAGADMILWLGPPAEAPDYRQLVRIHPKADMSPAVVGADLSVSALSGAGLSELSRLLIERGRTMLPREGDVALHRRHREALTRALLELEAAAANHDLLIVAEALRRARRALDEIAGRAGVEDMLDALFSRFCIGK